MRRRIRLLKPTPSPSTANATPAMTDDTTLPFSFPAVHAKKITAAFDGGRLTSNGGVMLRAFESSRARQLSCADGVPGVLLDGAAELPGTSYACCAASCSSPYSALSAEKYMGRTRPRYMETEKPCAGNRIPASYGRMTWQIPLRIWRRG